MVGPLPLMDSTPLRGLMGKMRRNGIGLKGTCSMIPIRREYFLLVLQLKLECVIPQALKNPFQVQRWACRRRPLWHPDPFCLLLLLLFAVQEEGGEEEEKRGRGMFGEKKFWDQAESTSTIQKPLSHSRTEPSSPISGLEKPLPHTSARRSSSSSFLCRSCRI